MNRIQASQEQLAHTLALSANVLRAYGANLYEDGSLVKEFPEMHKGIPIADTGKRLRRHVWSCMASELCDIAPPQTRKLGIARDAGEVDFAYEPQCYESRPPAGARDSGYLLGSRLQITVNTPDALAVETEHCIGYNNSKGLFYSSSFVLESFPHTMSAEEIAEAPIGRLGIEECAAIEGLAAAIPLLIHKEAYSKVCIGDYAS